MTERGVGAATEREDGKPSGILRAAFGREEGILGQRIRALLRCLTLATLAFPAAASAQDYYTMSLAVMGGIGGSQDAEPGDSFGNSAVQAEFSVLTQPQTRVGVRVGRLDLDDEDRFGSLAEARLEYVNIGGEYRYSQGYYDSGIYLALGGYRLSGDDLLGREQEETSLGLALGVTGDFLITQRLAFRVELSGHYADLEEAQLYGMAHAGLSLRF